MGTIYTDRDTVKTALQIPSSSTGDHAALDLAQEAVARLIDTYVGFPFYPTSDTLYFTPLTSTGLNLNEPVLAIDAIDMDFHGAGTSYDTSMSTACYYFEPYNAQNQSPPQPYWKLDTRWSATMVFPAGIKHSVRIKGTWGYYNSLTPSSATLATDIAAGATTIQLNFATALHVGNTILMGSERMTVTRTPASSTAGHTSTIDVLRGVNGSSGATHSCATAIQVYTYPVVDQAAQFQVTQDYRAKDAPLGFTGGEPFGTQQPRVTPAGLHPFTRRSLDGFRKPVAV